MGKSQVQNLLPPPPPLQRGSRRPPPPPPPNQYAKTCSSRVKTNTLPQNLFCPPPPFSVLPHRTFLKVLYFFPTISRFCTFFVLFSGLILFLYFFFINLAEFYQILFKSTVFVLFLEILQNECFAYL